jgi:hypothetical protein
LDFGFWIWDFGFWIWDFGFRVAHTPHRAPQYWVDAEAGLNIPEGGADANPKSKIQNPKSKI